MTKHWKLDQLKLAFFFYFRRIFWTQTQQGSQSHQAWIRNYDLCENAPKKRKHPQSLTFLEKSTTLSIVVKKNLAGKTLNPPSDDRKVSKEKGRRERFLKSQRQSYHSSVKIDAHPSAHSKGSRRVKDAFSGQINILN